MRKLLESFGYAICGIRQVILTQRNMQIHLAITAGVITGAAFFRFSRMEWLILILTILLVLMGEMVNTALEKAVDLASPEYHRLAKAAKDIAAGAVLLGAAGAVLVGMLLFGPHLLAFFR